MDASLFTARIQAFFLSFLKYIHQGEQDDKSLLGSELVIQ